MAVSFLISPQARHKDKFSFTSGYITADEDRKIANPYGMIHPNASDTRTVRSVFVIGLDKNIKLTLNYPASTGHNLGDVLRAIESLQLAAKNSWQTPVNWKEPKSYLRNRSSTPGMSTARSHRQTIPATCWDSSPSGW